MLFNRRQLATIALCLGKHSLFLISLFPPFGGYFYMEIVFLVVKKYNNIRLLLYVFVGLLLVSLSDGVGTVLYRIFGEWFRDVETNDSNVKTVLMDS